MLEHIGGRGDVPTFTCLECWCNARDKAKEAVDALKQTFGKLLKGGEKMREIKMRPIKFRAFDKVTCRMFYSDSQEDAKIIGAMLGESCIAKFFERFYGQEIMQFTGLLDKQGKEIYGGDIIASFYMIEQRGDVRQLDSGTWIIDYKDSQPMSLARELENYKCEVIGDIYSTPELLKGVK